jgi:hypothetical protein
LHRIDHALGGASGRRGGCSGRWRCRRC